MKIAVLADPLNHFKIYKDSTYAMMGAASGRGHELYALLQEDLAWRNGPVTGDVRKVQMTGDEHAWYVLGAATTVPLSDFDAVLVRKDPPFDMEYVYTTYLLERAQMQGAHVFNDPRAIRDHNEKISISEFPQFTIPSLVARRMDMLHDFLASHGDIILKPLDEMGGASVFRVTRKDPNHNVIIETITRFGQRTVMAQQFIPQVTDGDKRILLIAGKPVPYALARTPKPGETRANLAAGGSGVVRPLTPRDGQIAETLGPLLAARGHFLVGLDVIGDYVTEINVTSPTGFQEIKKQTGFDVASMMIDALEAEVNTVAA
jgi:glutathione synthase